MSESIFSVSSCKTFVNSIKEKVYKSNKKIIYHLYDDKYDSSDFPIIIQHRFVDDMPPPYEKYGIVKNMELYEILDLLDKNNLYKCSENDIYKYDYKKSDYILIKSTRNTDNGRSKSNMNISWDFNCHRK